MSNPAGSDPRVSLFLRATSAMSLHLVTCRPKMAYDEYDNNGRHVDGVALMG